MSDTRHNPYQASIDEYNAYAAQELARDVSVPMDKIFQKLGRYDQGVVDTRTAISNKKRRYG